MKTKVEIVIYQLIALFKGQGCPSENFNLIELALHNEQRTNTEQCQIVWTSLDVEVIFFVSVIPDII